MRWDELGKLCTIKSGGTPPRNQREYWGGEIPWAKISDLDTHDGGALKFTEEKISITGLEAIHNRIFPAGTILLAIYGSVGKTAVLGVESSCNQAILGIQIEDTTALNPEYLLLWLRSVGETLMSQAKGVAQKNISLKHVKELKVPLPPLEEQKRIARILDEADLVRKKTQALIDKYDELAQSLFLDMFGDYLKSTTKDWKRIPEILFFQEGPGVRNWQFRENGVKLLNGRNINDNQIDLNTTSVFISNEEAYGKYSHFLAEVGDLVIACSGVTLDRFHKKVALLKAEHLPLCMNTSTMRFKVLDESILNIQFFRYFLGSAQFLNQLRKLITGSAQLNFGPSHVKKMSVPCPPISLQNEFARLVEEIESESLKVSRCIQQDSNLFNVLLQKAFKGELNGKEKE
jgi:type I restriction enzyme S subunit